AERLLQFGHPVVQPVVSRRFLADPGPVLIQAVQVQGSHGLAVGAALLRSALAGLPGREQACVLPRLPDAGVLLVLWPVHRAASSGTRLRAFSASTAAVHRAPTAGAFHLIQIASRPNPAA